VVGIGASAGGLEALEQFFANVPKNSGMAYVVIQHLDPSHKGAMVELLQRVAVIPVLQVKDRQRIQPDHVYVIPPNKDMSLLHGVLHLLPQPLPRGLNLPIDFFFRSLAEDQGERSIGVVLSGMGSDGTLGLRAIKEKAGAGFVQSLSSAKFSGMPRSVIEAGLADVVGTANELPDRIIAYQQHAHYLGHPESVPEDKQLSALDKVFVLLRAHTGSDFSMYKRSTIYRRIERRMSLHQLDKLSNYVRYLRENSHEVELLFKELLIGVTSFFRDPHAWEHLKNELLPAFLKARADSGGVLRAWVPGCSTGEEAYSLAIAMLEVMHKLGINNLSLQIFATDLDREAIDRARQGIYPTNIAADVSAERLRRFFHQDERGYRVRKEIREAVVFAPQNLIMDPPFTKLDILACRNLLIYLAPELQKKLIPLFHYALNPGGLLFLGSAETVGTHTNLFTPADGKTRIYRRIDIGTPAVEFAPTFPVSHGPPHSAEVAEVLRGPPPNLGTLTDRVILSNFAPAAVLTNDKGDILYISGRTGRFLEPAVGRANLNIFAMAREGLRYELSNAFATAQREEKPISTRSVKVGSNGSAVLVDLTVQKLTEPKELRGTVLVVMHEVPNAVEPISGKQRRTHVTARMEDLDRELQHAREEVQTTREEMQTSQEELKSTNEELQSTNEELQSTNEELTTSKEEMQSMNEELQTVNHELRSKVDELSRSNNDMKNLLNSTDIATLFLDGDLLVRRFTNQTAKLIKLIPADAGRPITDIATELEYVDMADDAREVLRSLVFKEKTVTSKDGRWFSVRIMPYRTLENVIDGVVITFTDTTAPKVLEATLREQAGQLRQMAESLPNLMLGCRSDGTCEYVSRQWVDYTGVPEAEQVGYGWLDQLHPEERDKVREAWKGMTRSGSALDTDFRIRSADGRFRSFKARSAPIRDSSGAVAKWYLTATDIEDVRQGAMPWVDVQTLATVLDGSETPFLALAESGAVTHANRAAAQLLERPEDELLGKPLEALLPEAERKTFRAKLQEATRTRHPVAFETPLSRLTLIPDSAGFSVIAMRAPPR
jgi:two-component system CheB/CheR fusion protein